MARWILARLRNRKFFGLPDLNQGIHEQLEILLDRTMQHLGASRREFFEELDRPALKPLPAEPYEFAIWKEATVHIDYHVEFAKHYNSVPHELIGQKVFVRATEHAIEIFHPGLAARAGKSRRVASHRRSRAKGRHTTRIEHTLAPALQVQVCPPITGIMLSGPLIASCAARSRSALIPEI